MDAILFLHHRPLSDPVTMKHRILLETMNPDAELIPLCFETGRETPEWQWENCDILIFEWFDKVKPEHDRFFIFEWDVFCTQSLKEFYGDAYDKKSVGSVIMRPWDWSPIPSIDGEPRGMRKNWHWFNSNRSKFLYPFLRAIVPVCGAMFHREVLSKMVELWKTERDFDRVFCECRLGTLSCMAGYEPEEINEGCYKSLSICDVSIASKPGIYHRVRV